MIPVNDRLFTDLVTMTCWQRPLAMADLRTMTGLLGPAVKDLKARTPGYVWGMRSVNENRCIVCNGSSLQCRYNLWFRNVKVC